MSTATVDRKAYIAEHWQTATPGEIAQFLGVSRQYVSAEARRLGLPGKRSSEPTRQKAVCVACGNDFTVRAGRDVPEKCPACRPPKPPALGAKAFHLRKLTRSSWVAIADALDYRVGEDAGIRSHRIMMAAKDYARSQGYAWPIAGG